MIKNRSFMALLAFAAVVMSASTTTPKPKLWAAGEMQWRADAALPGVQGVVLWGDPKTGAHGMLRRFPAGYAPPLHTHPSVERLVVIAGTVIVRSAASPDKRLGPGSYSEIPANIPHAAECTSESDCEFVLVASGPFAIHRVESH